MLPVFLHLSAQAALLAIALSFPWLLLSKQKRFSIVTLHCTITVSSHVPSSWLSLFTNSQRVSAPRLCLPLLFLLPCGTLSSHVLGPQMPWPLGSFTSSPAMISSSLDQLLCPTIKLPRDFFLAPGPPKSPCSDFLLACSFKPTHHLSPPPSHPLLLLTQPQCQGVITAPSVSAPRLLHLELADCAHSAEPGLIIPISLPCPALLCLLPFFCCGLGPRERQPHVKGCVLCSFPEDAWHPEVPSTFQNMEWI